jgi:hypothetical protein
MEAARGQKQPSDAENEGGVSLLKKVFKMKNPIMGPIRFELQPQGRKL